MSVFKNPKRVFLDGAEVRDWMMADTAEGVVHAFAPIPGRKPDEVKQLSGGLAIGSNGKVGKRPGPLDFIYRGQITVVGNG